jgi:hypothetical protein
MPEAVFPDVKSQVVKLYQSPASIAGVHNEWSLTSTAPYSLLECTVAT